LGIVRPLYVYPYEGTIDLASIGVSFPATEVYEQTSLAPGEDEQADFSSDDGEEPI
jgi:hypothetical protein